MAALPETTIIPFGSLPSCAAECFPLYDANGACVPPIVNSVDNDCFCNHGALAPWDNGVTGVCDGAPCQPNEFSSIHSWFTSYCAAAQQEAPQTTSGDSPASTDPSATGTSRSGTQNQGGGDWISNHWRWVIGIVILVVGIAGIWIGACIWRRRYLKRKERAHHFGKHTSTSAFPAPGGSSVHNGTPAPGYPNNNNNNVNSAPAGPGMFMPGAAATHHYEEKPKKEKKKWIVRERT